MKQPSGSDACGVLHTAPRRPGNPNTAGVVGLVVFEVARETTWEICPNEYLLLAD